MLNKMPPEIGGLAQLARALAWHARGQRFESVILHQYFEHRKVQASIEIFDILKQDKTVEVK